MEVQAPEGTRLDLETSLYWTTIVSSFLVLAWLNGRDIDPRAGSTPGCAPQAVIPPSWAPLRGVS